MAKARETSTSDPEGGAYGAVRLTEDAGAARDVSGPQRPDMHSGAQAGTIPASFPTRPATPTFQPSRSHQVSTANYGFLGEMSIVELQERLALLKESQKKAEEEKRDSIIREKRNKERLLLDKLEQIALFREAYGRTAALKQEEKKIKPEVREGLLNDERVLDLQRKIAEKSMERKMQAGLLKSASMKFDQRSKKAPKLPLQDDYWQKLEGSRQQLSKMLQPDIMPREAAQKTMARVASRIGTSSCILRS